MTRPRSVLRDSSLYLVLAAFLVGAWISSTMFGVAYEHLATALVGWLVIGPHPSAAQEAWQGYQAVNRTPSTCPDYNEWSQEPHPPYSSGPLGLPYMRPSPECRTFNSSAMEKVITDMNGRLKDRDLAQLFSNAMGNTLDTTVKYFDPERNLAFIITGDITAQWLRDTGNQFAHLYRLLPNDPELQALVKAVINTEARYITQFPYCGAFQPPPESGLAPTLNGYSLLVEINPPVDNQTVFECKYELDSLAGFLKMSSRYYEQTKDDSFINDNFMDAINTIMQVIHDQSLPAWTDDFVFQSYYNWTGLPGSSSPPVKNGGNGEPWAGNGLVRSHHRPSDDLCVYPYITGDNAMVSVELDNIAQVLESTGKMPEVAAGARKYSATIKDAIWAHTINNGLIQYESDGFGSFSFMDDANVPGSASLAYVGFLDRNDTTYQATKSALFSRQNPYYAEGSAFKGFGGPHAFPNVWPMSKVSEIYGSDDDSEILDSLFTILNGTSGLGLVHESINVHNASDYTRPWFAWANSYFAEMILDLGERKPHLVFDDATPYIAGQ